MEKVKEKFGFFRVSKLCVKMESMKEEDAVVRQCNLVIPKDKWILKNANIKYKSKMKT